MVQAVTFKGVQSAYPYYTALAKPSTKQHYADEVLFGSRRDENRRGLAIRLGLHSAILASLLSVLTFVRGGLNTAQTNLVPLPEASAQVVQVVNENPGNVSRQALVYQQLGSIHQDLKANYPLQKDATLPPLPNFTQQEQEVTQQAVKDMSYSLNCLIHGNPTKALEQFNQWADQVLAPKTDADTLAAIKAYAAEQVVPTQSKINNTRGLYLLVVASAGLVGGFGANYLLKKADEANKADKKLTQDPPPTEPPTQV